MRKDQRKKAYPEIFMQIKYFIGGKASKGVDHRQKKYGQNDIGQVRVNVLQDFHKIDFLRLNVRIFKMKTPAQRPGFVFTCRCMP